MGNTAQQLIEKRMSEMPIDTGMEYKYFCLDTGMSFCTYGESAMYSPFTGSMNIEDDTSDMDSDIDMNGMNGMNSMNGTGSVYDEPSEY